MKARLIRFLRWTEKYTKTDMVYFASGNFWLMTSRIISIGTGIVLSIAFANLLPKEVFGTFKYILAIAGTVTAFSLTGLSTSLTKAVAQGNRDIVRPAFRIGLLWSVPTSVVCLALSAYYFANDNKYLALGLLFISLFTPFFNSFGNYKGLMQGMRDFKGLAIFNIPRTLLPVAAMITTLLLTESLMILIGVYFLSNLIASWLVYRFTLRKHAVGNSKEGLGETVTYAKHLSLLGIVTQFASQADLLLIGHFLGPAPLAIYTFAFSPVRELRNFTENFFPVIFPKLAVKEISDIKKSMPLRIGQMTIVTCAMTGIYVLLAPYFFKIFFPQYLSSVFYSQLLAIAILFQPKGLIETLLIAHGEVKKRYIAIGLTHLVEVAVFLALIPTYGILGAVIGTLISEAIGAFILFIAYKRL